MEHIWQIFTKPLGHIEYFMAFIFVLAIVVGVVVANRKTPDSKK